MACAQYSHGQYSGFNSLLVVCLVCLSYPIIQIEYIVKAQKLVPYFRAFKDTY